jgi:hypothetical protein
MSRLRSGSLNRLCCVIVLGLLGEAAHAERWIVTSRVNLSPYGGQTETELAVDVDSIWADGDVLKYRSRFPRYQGGFSVELAGANCVDHTRGAWPDFRMYSTYPSTRNGYEVAAVCSEARRRGLIDASGKVDDGHGAPETPVEAAPSAPAEPKPETVAAASGETKREAQKFRASGSGFFVEGRLVVTNFHVVEAAPSSGCEGIRRPTRRALRIHRTQ